MEHLRFPLRSQERRPREVTRVVFGPDKPHGVALARMVRMKRPGIIKVVFVAREENAPYTEDLGVFLPRPLNPDMLVATVSRLLNSPDDDDAVKAFFPE